MNKGIKCREMEELSGMHIKETRINWAPLKKFVKINFYDAVKVVAVFSLQIYFLLDLVTTDCQQECPF